MSRVICNRLDPSSLAGLGAKMAIDATLPLDQPLERVAVPTEASAFAERLLAQL